MFRFHVWGERACFVRPEFSRDRVSYDVMPPLAARGIVESIYWSPAIRWLIDRIYVLRPIVFDQASSDDDRRFDLVDVEYMVDAHFILSERARPSDHVAQHASLVRRRATRQEPYRQPFLGTKEYPAQFRLVPDDECPASALSDDTIDLGWMIHDFDLQRPSRLRYFRPTLDRGVIEVAETDVDNLPV